MVMVVFEIDFTQNCSPRRPQRHGCQAPVFEKRRRGTEIDQFSEDVEIPSSSARRQEYSATHFCTANAGCFARFLPLSLFLLFLFRGVTVCTREKMREVGVRIGPPSAETRRFVCV